MENIILSLLGFTAIACPAFLIGQTVWLIIEDRRFMRRFDRNSR